MLDVRAMKEHARSRMTDLGIMTIQNMGQPVETLSGGQRQGVAVARAAAFESRVVIMDEPTAALGVKESNRVLNLIRTLRDRGLPIILISHDMPHVFEVADRIHIQRLGRRGAIVTPQSHTMRPGRDRRLHRPRPGSRRRHRRHDRRRLHGLGAGRDGRPGLAADRRQQRPGSRAQHPGPIRPDRCPPRPHHPLPVPARVAGPRARALVDQVGQVNH
jgi:energy-coupling factor transporter ATP-binding protein EcfA2